MTTEKPMQTLPFPSPDLAEEDGQFTLLQPLAAGLVDHPCILGLTSPVHTESDNSRLEKVQSEPRRKVKNLVINQLTNDDIIHFTVAGIQI